MTTYSTSFHHSPLVARAWALQSIYNLLLGAVLLVGGDGRIVGPSFDLIRELGGSATWGAAFLGLGVTMFMSALAGLWGRTAIFGAAALCHAWFAAMFIANAFASPSAALTGCVTYLAIAFWHVSVASSFREDWQRR